MYKANPESLGWIPVKKRLPKHAWVRILITNGKYVSVSRARILVAHPDVATHWMPLTSRKVKDGTQATDREALVRDLGDRLSDEILLKAADPNLLLLD